MDSEGIQDLFDRASRFQQVGQFQQAQSLYQQILSSDPRHADTLHMMGVLAFRARQLESAADFIRRAIASQSNSAGYHCTLGQVLLAQGRPSDAALTLQRAVELDSNSAEAFFYLGNAWQTTGDFKIAVGVYRRSLAIKPGVPVVLNNQAVALRASGNIHEAIAMHREALRLDPSSADFHSNYGGSLQELALYDEAISEFRRALDLNPNLSEAKGCLGLALLLQGELIEGFQRYESRLALINRYRPQSGPPLWDGALLNGKRILLRSEQGFGDTIQFIRYSLLVRERGGRVIVSAPIELKRLLTSQLGIEQIVSKGDPLSPCDVQCMLMSLPVHFQTTLQTVPATIPYLHADPVRAQEFHDRMRAKSETRTSKIERNTKSEQETFKTDPRPLNVGLVWAGGPRTKHDRTRSLALSALSRLFEIPGIQWISLQKGSAAQQLNETIATRNSQMANVFDWTSDLADFADTAALICALDLVISVDTAVAHLAGALGKPVWTLIPYVPDWRWLLGRSDSPWYPTMRLFRQPGMGDWKGAIEVLARELRSLVQEHKRKEKN